MSDNPLDPNKPSNEEQNDNKFGWKDDDQPQLSDYNFGALGSSNEPGASQPGYGAPYGGQQQQGFGGPYGGQQPPPGGQYVYGYGYGHQQPQGQTFSWFEAWRMALTKPSVQTYQTLYADPKATTDRAFIWLILMSGFISIVSAFSQAILALGFESSGQSFLGTDNSTSGTATSTGLSVGGSLIVNLICGVPLFIIFMLLGTIIILGIVHVTARIFGGTGTFDKTLYGYAVIYSPYYLLSGILSLAISIFSFVPILFLIAYCGLLLIGLLVVFYGLYLQTVAIKAAHNIGWGESFISVISPMLISCFCIFACVGSLVLLGASTSASA